MAVNTSRIYKETLRCLEQARSNLLHKSALLEHSAISDVIPGFQANQLEFGSYDKENYAVLFVDMRKSTWRAEYVGAEKTFLTMHVFLTALLQVVQHYHGNVIDIMGDGLMVFWGGRKAREEDRMVKRLAIKNAGLCGRDMLAVRREVINRIIQEKDLGPVIDIGVGVTYGDVIVTKIGIEGYYDVKAFGDCINKASHYADEVRNKVKVSKQIKEGWPTSPGGKIRFAPAQAGDGYYLERSS